MDSYKIGDVPWGEPVFPKRRFYYAYGNTPMFDVMDDLILPERSLDILLLGASDVRNGLYTAKKHQDQINEYRPIVFHLNDVMPAIVARNVLLLEIIATINPSCKDDMDFLWSVWYNMDLSEAHYQRLVSILDHLVSVPFRPSCHIEYGSLEMLENSRMVWLSWIALFISIDEAREKRQSTDVSDRDYYNDKIQPKVLVSTTHVVEDLEMNKWMRAEIIDVFKRGSVTRRPFVLDVPKQINPTLWIPSSRAWECHFAIHPFVNYAPLNTFLLEKHRSVFQCCFMKLTSLVKATQYLLLHDRSIQFKVWEGEAISLGYKNLPQHLKFDFIYTSNLPDYVGLINILTTWSPRLKTDSSLLFSETMFWTGIYQNIQDYINTNVPISMTMMPTLFRLHFTEDLDLGGKDVPLSLRRFPWKASCDQTSPFVLGRDLSDSFLTELRRLSRFCFKTDPKMDLADGGGTVTAWAFLQTLLLLKKQIDTTLSDLLNLAEQMLPVIHCSSSGIRHSYFYESWRGLLCHERLITTDFAVVKMKFPLPHDFASVSQRGHSKIMALAIFEVPADASKYFHVISNGGIEGEIFIGAIHLFYNFLYDVESEILTLFMEEKTWKRLSATDASVIFYCRSDWQRRTLALSCASAKYRPVIPKHTSLESQIKHNEIEVTKFEEKLELYDLTLKVLNKVIFPNDVKVSVLGGKRANAIVVKFKRINETKTFTLSCPVQEDSAEVKTLKDSVNITIKKNRLLTAGEAVIARPLIAWSDLKQIDDLNRFMETSRLFTMMFSNHELETAQYMSRSLEEGGHFAQLRFLLGVYKHEGEVLQKIGCRSANTQRWILVVVRGHYIWNGLPLVKVSWVDAHHYKNGPQEMKTISEKLHLDYIVTNRHEKMCSDEVLQMLSRLLQINALRVKQPECVDAGKSFGNSFLQLRFHQESPEYRPPVGLNMDHLLLDLLMRRQLSNHFANMFYEDDDDDEDDYFW